MVKETAIEVVDSDTGEVVKSKQIRQFETVSKGDMFLKAHNLRSGQEILARAALAKLPMACSIALQEMAHLMDDENLFTNTQLQIKKILKSSPINSDNRFRTALCELVKANLVKRVCPMVYMITPEIYCKVSHKKEDILRDRFRSL